jgi:hypothetical protein
VSQPYEVVVVLIGQNNDTRFWSLTSHLPDDLKDTTGILACLDQNQSNIRD